MNIREEIAKELHKSSRKNFYTRPVVLKGINDLYQGDLVEMLDFSRVNSGFKYIMTIINCFTKFAFAVPLKTKTGLEVAKALSPILSKQPMKHFQTDNGTEWYNTNVRSLLKEYKINHYSTFSDKKASIVERFNRTLKQNMWRAFSAQGSFKWLKLLPTVVDKYNKSVHRTIGLKPKDVNKNNEKLVLTNILNNRKIKYFKPKFKVGDAVRISRIKKDFTKGYWPQWSNEIYIVHKVQPTVPVTYLLKDNRGEIIKGGFYQEELNKSKYKDTYLIEKVIKRKGEKLLVRWLGFDKTHDSWIDKKDLLK